MTDTAPGPGVARCPQCFTDGALPIHYGYPEPEQIRAAVRGEIALGGMVLDADPPGFECRNDHCGYTFSA